MQSKIKVLLFIDHLGAGGAQEHIWQLARHLHSGRLAFSVCALHTAGHYRDKFAALGVDVTLLASRRSYLKLPAAVWGLSRMLRDSQFALVHTLLEGAFTLGTPVARLHRIPTVHTILANELQVTKRYRALFKMYAPLIHKYIFPYEPEILLNANVSREKALVMRGLISLEDMLEVEHDADLPLPPFDLQGAFPVGISMGRLHPDKGQEYAIRAWRSVMRAFPNARLLIVGTGKDEGRLKALAGRLGLKEAVFFAGYRRDIQRLFSRADVFLRTSLKEGSNLATKQALAAGLPVVAIKNPAPIEIIKDGENGLLVELGDIEALAQAIITLSKQDGLRREIGEGGRISTSGLSTLDKSIERYREFYESIPGEEL